MGGTSTGRLSPNRVNSRLSRKRTLAKPRFSQGRLTPSVANCRSRTSADIRTWSVRGSVQVRARHWGVPASRSDFVAELIRSSLLPVRGYSNAIRGDALPLVLVPGILSIQRVSDPMCLSAGK